MSLNILKLIPSIPHYVPSDDQQAKAKKLEDPNGEPGNDELKQLQEILGTEIRLIWARY